MKKNKIIKAVIPPPATHMVGDGFRVHNFFPSGTEIGMYGMSPFFLCDYNSEMMVVPSDRPKGVGVHPHRGIETVTLAYKGAVAHNDSAGNSGVIHEGDVQWMTAGEGILHKEYYEMEFTKRGGPFQMVQLWVNLPAKFKMTSPRYQAIERTMMGKYQLPEESGVIDVIAGEYKGIKGPASVFSPVSLMNARLNKGASADFTFPMDYNSAMLVINGKIRINEADSVPVDHLVLFSGNGEQIHIEAVEKSLVLVMSGEPIKEVLSAYGPFLMNTKEEIQRAFDDFYSGKFGYLED